MGTRDESTPSFELPAPTESHAGRAMRSRIAGRLFDEPGPSQRVAHYEILRRVGAGGMGVVYAARDTKLDRVVALKLVRQRAMSERARERLVQEAQTLAKLSHPNVVQVYEVGEYEAAVYIAMEFVEGQTLGRWIASKRPKLTELLAMFRAAGDGLAAAHAAGIVHRDFKPGNVLVGDDGRVRVADFGIAQRLDDAEGERALKLVAGESNKVAGTPGYIDPRLLTGEAADAHSDQYGFCVALWEAVSGERPYPSATIVEALEGGEPPAPRGQLRPRWLRLVLTRGLAFDVSARWPSLGDLLDELDAAQRRRRAARWLALPSGLILALAILVDDPPPVSCTDADGFATVWTPAIANELLAHSSGDPRASAVVAELSTYAANWRESSVSLCRAHHEEASLSAEGLDLGGDCLLELRARAGQAIETLRRDAPASFEHADALLDALPPPGSCTDPHLLRARATPSSPRAIVADLLDARLDQNELDMLAGHLERAYDEAASLAEETQALDAHAHARALLQQGQAARQLGRFDLASTQLAKASAEAERAGDEELSLRARLELVAHFVEDREQLDAATVALAGAKVPLERLHSPPHLEADLLVAEAEIAELRGELPRAEALLARALRAQNEVGVSSRELDRTHLRMLNLIAKQGRRENALEGYGVIVERRIAEFGADHPAIAAIHLNIALTWMELERWELALPHTQRAVAIREQSQPNSPDLAAALTSHAEVRLELDEVEPAIRAAQRAVAIQRRLPKDHSERASGLSILALTLIEEGRYGDALEVELELLAALAPYPQPVKDNVHQVIGWLSARRGLWAQAETHSKLAMRSVDPAVRIYAEHTLAECLLVRGQSPEARRVLDEIAGAPEIQALRDSDPRLEAAFQYLQYRLAAFEQPSAPPLPLDAKTLALLPTDQAEAVAVGSDRHTSQPTNGMD